MDGGEFAQEMWEQVAGSFSFVSFFGAWGKPGGLLAQLCQNFRYGL